MKNYIIIIPLFLFALALFNMPVNVNPEIIRKLEYNFIYSGSLSPTIKKEKLHEARYINEIMPEFVRNFKLYYSKSVPLDQLLKIIEPVQGYYFTPPNAYTRRYENYEDLMTVVAIEILTTYQGKIHSSKSTSSVLTADQKGILNAAEHNTDIQIKIKFKYKDWAMGTKNRREIEEGMYAVTVIPQTEAVYPGGFEQLNAYITEHIIAKIPVDSDLEKIRNATVKFTINEQGQAVDVCLSGSSTDAKIDRLILDIIHKMPVWKPALDSKGLKIKQEFTIPFGSNRC